MNEIVVYYDTIAGIYDQDRFDNTYGRFLDAQERLVLSQLLASQPGVVLDLACGSGRLLNYANCGVDASAEMAAIARRKFPEKPVYVADACATGLADCSVDAIISFHFFMHLSREPLNALLRECARILRPTGRLIFDIPSKKRRQLLRYQATGWHGGFSLSRAEVSCLHPAFSLRRSFGLLLLPIHRVPKGLRKSLGRLDFKLANSFLKEYSSYQVFELVKQ